MIDISAAVLSVAGSKRSTDTASSEVILEAVRTAISGTVLWDGIGEDWATIMVGDLTAVHVFMFGRLIIVIEPYAGAVSRAVVPMVPVITKDMDSVELRADPAALVAAFGERVISGELDPHGFSANDLWFSSI